MALFSTIAAGASATGLRPQKIFEPISNLFGGGREEGYGLAKEGTLAWYIDKLKGVNDKEALNLADRLISARSQGATNSQIIQFLKQNSSEGVLGPEEYNPILRKLDAEVSKQAPANARPATPKAAAASVMPDLSGVAKIPGIVWAGVAAVIAFLFYNR